MFAALASLRRMAGCYLVVFTASACTLILEIVAGRILAPAIGVSLYTWTSVIGVVLAGISLGNYLGGKIADRFPSPATLGLILLASAASTFGVLVLLMLVPEVAPALPLIPRILFLTAALFFLPSCIMGMVTPVVIKGVLRDLNYTGSVVGKIYAVSTVGSIVGTYLTGFILISWFGTRLIVLGIGIVLLLIALVFGNLGRIGSGVALVVVLAFGGLAFRFDRLSLDSGCLRESHYYCIKVYDQIVGSNQRVKTLALDHLIHSYNSLEDPTFLTYGYTKIYAEVTNKAAQGNSSLRTLSIGGGGYTVPRYLKAKYPQSRVEVIEIDPAVTAVAQEHLGLSPDLGIISYNEDARMAITQLPERAYDFVYGDAFNDLSIPYHLTTREFNAQIRRVLKEEGVYLANVIDKIPEGEFVKAYVHTLEGVFPYVAVLAEGEAWRSNAIATYVVAASLRPLDFTNLVNASGDGPAITRLMPQDRFEEWLAKGRRLLLTDDYAPVDNLIAPLFVERGL